MSLEIEKQFKTFDYNNIKKIFKQKNINRVGGFLFKLTSYKGTKNDQYIRIRDEGKKITFTIKQKTNNQYVTEYEVVVDNYEMINKMLLQLGVQKNYDLHKYREIYITKNKKSEIIFDHYPGLPPYMEIESQSESELNKMIKLLKLKEEKFTAADLYYELYGITQDRKYDDLTFDNAKQKFNKLITKNKDKFNELLAKQQKKFLK